MRTVIKNLTYVVSNSLELVYLPLMIMVQVLHNMYTVSPSVTKPRHYLNIYLNN